MIRQERSVLYFTYFRESAYSVSMVVTAKRSAIDGMYILGLTPGCLVLFR